jgi:SAM-dependent methyltransferase
MMKPATGDGVDSANDLSKNARLYKKAFWSTENLKFNEPWYRLEKSAQLISGLARGQECTLLDIGCGPATLMRMLPQNVHYYGIDMAIHEPAANLLEADILESPIAFEGRSFDLVIAQGLFEYLGNAQSQKFAEIAEILNTSGKFVVTYTNFSHRKKQIYSAFSNVQSLDSFRLSLSRHFRVERSFPASHNWKHGQPARSFVKAANMRVNFNIPVVSPLLAVEYYFICSSRSSSGADMTGRSEIGEARTT